MSKELQKSPDDIVQCYENTPNWQNYAIGAAIGAAVVLTGGAIAYAIITYGITATSVSAAGSTSIAIGKAISGSRG